MNNGVKKISLYHNSTELIIVLDLQKGKRKIMFKKYKKIYCRLIFCRTNRKRNYIKQVFLQVYSSKNFQILQYYLQIMTITWVKNTDKKFKRYLNQFRSSNRL